MRTRKQYSALDGRSKSSEAVLFKQAQAGCRACLNQLMARHEGLVPFVVRRQTLGQLSFAAALQAGRIGLWRAIRGYDPRRGYAFSTYAYTAIARHIWQAVKQAEGAKASPVAMAAAPMMDGIDPAVIWEASRVGTALHQLVERLPSRISKSLHRGRGEPLGQVRRDDQADPGRTRRGSCPTRWVFDGVGV